MKFKILVVLAGLVQSFALSAFASSEMIISCKLEDGSMRVLAENTALKMVLGDNPGNVTGDQLEFDGGSYKISAQFLPKLESIFPMNAQDFEATMFYMKPDGSAVIASSESSAGKLFLSLGGSGFQVHARLSCTRVR
jgi:hypothetical protein